MDLTNDLKVLVVDDERVTAQMNQLLLQRNIPGIDVLIADDMDVLLVMAQNPDITLVISDYDMPEITGMGLFEAIRTSGNNVPFVLSTGGNEERQAEIEADFASKGGNAAFTTKPFSIDKLTAALSFLEPKPAAGVAPSL